jgi:hypothetical protein
MQGERIPVQRVLRMQRSTPAAVPASRVLSLAAPATTILLAGALLVAGAGCASPQLYTTAYSHRGPPEVSIGLDPVYVASNPSSTKSVYWFGDVQVRLRLQAGKHCDVGLLVGLPRIGADGKCSLVQTKNHALALSAGVSATIWDMWFNGLVLYTFRNDGWALTFQGGSALMVPLDKASRSPLSLNNTGSGLKAEFGSLDNRGVYARGGLSFSFGGNPRWQPEVNVYHQLHNDRITYITFGIGFHLGGPIEANDPFAPKEPAITESPAAPTPVPPVLPVPPAPPLAPAPTAAVVPDQAP